MGTYCLRARSYNPATGRFTQEDSAKDGLNWYTYCANNPVRLIDPSGNSYKYVNQGLVTRGRHDYHRIEITIDAKSQVSTHTFYIRDKEDVIRFYNNENDTKLAFRSKDLAQGMLDAFKQTKGYDLSERTVNGIHSELVLHDALYRAGVKPESTTEADMGSLRVPLLSGRLPNTPIGNDNDAWFFEVAQGDQDTQLFKSAIETYGMFSSTLSENQFQRKQFSRDLEYLLSGEYFTDKLLRHYYNQSNN